MEESGLIRKSRPRSDISSRRKKKKKVAQGRMFRAGGKKKKKVAQGRMFRPGKKPQKKFQLGFASDLNEPIVVDF